MTEDDDPLDSADQPEDDALDDATALGATRGLEEATRRRPRRQAVEHIPPPDPLSEDAGAALDEATAQRTPPDEATALRAGRRRAEQPDPRARRPAPVTGASRRAAVVPEPGAREVVGPRADAPAMARRRSRPSGTGRQRIAPSLARGGGETERARRRLLGLVGVIVAVVAAGAAGVALLLPL